MPKITQLPNMGTADGSELLVVVQSGVTKKASASSLLALTLASSGLFKVPATEFVTATAGQTVINFSSLTYTIGTGNLNIWLNGLKLETGVDFAETSTTSITMVSPLSLGDEIEAQAGGQLNSILNTDLTYRYPATGAVTTTVSAKIDDMAANPEDFGAVGDGVTDDTAAFQAAINWLQALGQDHMTLALAAKPYRIVGTLSVSRAVRFVGEGFQVIEAGRPITRPAKGTWLIHANPTGPMFAISGKGAAFFDIAFFQEGHATPGVGWVPAVRDWVIRNENSEGELVLDRVHFHNFYYGVLSILSHRPQFGHITGQFFNRGFFFDQIYDIGKFDYLHAWTFWSEDTNVLQWTQANGAAIAFGRCDGMYIGHIFTFALAMGIYCGPSLAAGPLGGPARVIKVSHLYADFTGRALVVDNSICYVAIDSMFHLGQAWPVAPVAALVGSCGVHIASGTNSHVQVGTYYGALCETASVKMQGVANQLTIESPIFEQFDKALVGSGPIYCEAANEVFLGNTPQVVNYAGAATELITGAAAGVVKIPVTQQYLGGTAKNKIVTAANATGQLAVVTAEGDSTAGVAVLAKTTGIVNVGASTNVLAFYGGGGVTKQTGVPVTAAGIHAALVALGLIAP